MPVNRRHPIAELLEAGDAWTRAADWPVTYEYVLIGDVTCTADAAFELVQYSPLQAQPDPAERDL